MALGRFLFIFINHALWLIAHAIFKLPAEHAYLLFKYAVVAESAFAVIACWLLARELTHSIAAATMAALLIAASPAFIVYSGQVMTEIPSVLLTATALVVHLRGLQQRRMWLVLTGAMLLGASVNIRETALFYTPWLALAPLVCGWKMRGRELLIVVLSCALFCVCAFGIFAVWFAIDAFDYRASWYGWRASMWTEAARHPIAFRNLLSLLLYFFAASPLVALALPIAGWREWQRRGLSPLLALACAGLFADSLLFFNYSTAINWRYLLTGLPALAPLAADYFLRAQTIKLGDARRAFWSITLAVIFIVTLFAVYHQALASEYLKKRALTKDYIAQLRGLPPDAVLMAGAQTVGVTYWRGLGAGNWEVIGTGGGWPGAQLSEVVEKYLSERRRIFLDVDSRWWSPCGWQVEEARELATLESHFHFRRVSETIYEIKLPNDQTAIDAPNLQSLLPENRVAEVKRCLR